MYNGLYQGKQGKWRVDLRVELISQDEVAEISGDLFELKGSTATYVSSFSIQNPEQINPVGNGDGGIEVTFENHEFLLKPTNNDNIPKEIVITLQSALYDPKPHILAKLEFTFKGESPPGFPLIPFECTKISGYFRRVKLHLLQDQLDFQVPFPLKAMSPAVTPWGAGDDDLKAIFEKETIHLKYKNPTPPLLDGSQARGSGGWKKRELHQLMVETGFNPNPTSLIWKVWAYITDSLDKNEFPELSVAGYSFDDIGDRKRQGIAIFMEHDRFNGFNNPPGSNEYHYAANSCLYTLSHEIAHAIGLEHSEDFTIGGANIPNLMNADMQFSDGPTNDWRDFDWSFLPGQSRLLRHATWFYAAPGSSGPATQSFSAEKKVIPDLELRIRSQKIFLCGEPLELEVRLRNKGQQVKRVYPVFVPEARVILYRIRPKKSGEWQTVMPLVKWHGIVKARRLKGKGQTDGSDRTSGLIPPFYSEQGLQMLAPGEYSIQAVYKNRSGAICKSNIHTVRVIPGTYEWQKNLLKSKNSDLRRQLLEFFYLNGSPEPRFGPVRRYLKNSLKQVNLLLQTTKNAKEKQQLLRLRAKWDRLLALSTYSRKWEVEKVKTERLLPDTDNTDKGLTVQKEAPSFRLKRLPVTEKAYKKAANRMNRCIQYYQKSTGNQRQNFAYRRAVEEQMAYLTAIKEENSAKLLHGQLQGDLKQRGVKTLVLKQMAQGDQLATINDADFYPTETTGTA